MYLTKRRLRHAEPLHDGQGLSHNQVISASTLYGYAYTDHWAVALPPQRRWPYWGGIRTFLAVPGGQTDGFQTYTQELFLKVYVRFTTSAVDHSWKSHDPQQYCLTSEKAF